ncbi:MAG: Coenzyme F420 hydrogenase/dehydrogenase, beta subunit C-terminal domain [Methanomicrobiaceae archaeon]|nr:Coenzyme F420 hydrogenase/dehydrogenase, beta subunit C-terminal domain [Methanomicrobiaceae archaeon]
MAHVGDLLYAWTTDEAIRERAETGGAVTTLLKHALESGMVDGVFAVRQGADVYDAHPAFITDPAELWKTAGSLHCGTLLLPKQMRNCLLAAQPAMKLAVVLKGCDVKAIYEMAKRNQVNLDNIVIIGLNCGGTIRPEIARQVVSEKLGVDPDTVVNEEIDKGKFIIETADGEHKSISIDDLEEEDLGRRSNCRRCKIKIPRQADLACGNWGVIGEKAGKATFIEVCSEKGMNLLNGAVTAGKIETEPAPGKGIEIRKKVENSMLKLGDRWRERYFSDLGEARERLEKIMLETSRCIKCYSCIENCPICYCKDCSARRDYLVEPGRIPPPFMFHLIRFAHISDSCVNCGQCEELCPVDIPNSVFMHALQVDLEEMFGYHPGEDMTLPILALVEEQTERERLAATGGDQIFDIFAEKKK